MWRCSVVVRAAAYDPVNRDSIHGKYLSFFDLIGLKLAVHEAYLFFICPGEN